MTPIDEAYERTRRGDPEGFAAWVRLAEPALRRGLRRFARVVDTESVLQEGLMRIWVLAPTLPLAGSDASLRYAHTLVANLARHEARRFGHTVPLDDENDSPAVDPAPVSDPGLRAAILDCLGKLPRQPGLAIAARLGSMGDESDRTLAERVGMTLNTFLQNIVRARRHLADCLRGHGVSLQEGRP